MPEVRTVSPLCRPEARCLILREGLRGRCRRADLAVKQEKRPIANFELLFIFRAVEEFSGGMRVKCYLECNKLLMQHK